MFPTHEVFNQAEPLVNTNVWASHRPLQDALKFNAPQLNTDSLRDLGALLGSTDMQTHARLANVHLPQLHSHDRWGRRIDEVEFHPSYHVLMSAAAAAGLHGAPWQDGASASPHVRRAAAFTMFTELEPSMLCPISMTYAVMPALRGNAAIHADWAPKLGNTHYDPALKVWRDKSGLTMGMATFLEVQLDTALRTYVNTASASMTGYVASLAVGLAALYWLVFGMTAMRGDVNEPMSKITKDVVTMLLVAMVVFTFGNYQNFVIESLYGLVADLFTTVPE